MVGMLSAKNTASTRPPCKFRLVSPSSGRSATAPATESTAMLPHSAMCGGLQGLHSPQSTSRPTLSSTPVARVESTALPKPNA